jgi:6-phosphofructokinase 1
MRRIAVLTSGGDAPGMNAAIRAVVRCGHEQGWEVLGVRDGYSGLISGAMSPLADRDVGGIIQQGGTVLGSARCPEFVESSGQQLALASLRRDSVDALVIIGGNGTQAGSHALWQAGFPVVGIASTIDNDLCGSDVTIGVDSALAVALEAIDRLKVTATSHRRGFLVEVMGRNCGYLALMAGIAGGAEAVVIPERETDPEALVEDLRQGWLRGKSHAIVVVAEGARYNAARLLEYFRAHRERLDINLRATILGHVQRGGAPTAFDRLLATRFGAAAVQQLAVGNVGVLVGLRDGAVTTTPLDEVVSSQKPLDTSLLDLAKTLTR